MNYTSSGVVWLDLPTDLDSDQQNPFGAIIISVNLRKAFRPTDFKVSTKGIHARNIHVELPYLFLFWQTSVLVRPHYSY